MTNVATSVEEHLASLVGSRCWSVIGDQTPDAHIGLGDKVCRRHPLTNPTLTSDEREFEPTLDILIKCPWLLEASEHVLSWTEDGGMALKVLVGEKLEEVEAEPPGWDLSIRFTGDFHLRLRVSEPRDVYDSFSIGVNGRYWSVSAGGAASWT